MKLVFGRDTKETAAKLARQTNPCLKAYGLGPAGLTCETCCHLIARHFHRTVYKCALRKNTGGPATDHRVGWPACGRYENHEEEIP